MTTSETQATMHVPAREVPVPTSVSPEAQAALAMGYLGPPPREYPALDDVAGWKAYVAETDGFVRSMVGNALDGFTGTIEERDIGPCPLYVVTPDSVRDDDNRVYFDIHGGAWVLGGGDLCKSTAVASANQVGARERGRWTTGCRPTTRSRPRSTTALRPTGCSSRRPVRRRSSSAARRRAGTWRARWSCRTRRRTAAPGGGRVQHRRVRPHRLQRFLADQRRHRQHPLGQRRAVHPPLRGGPRHEGPVHLAALRRSQRVSAHDPPHRTRATCCSPTTSGCTGVCAPRASRQSSTCGKRPGTAASSAWLRRTPSVSARCAGSWTSTGGPTVMTASETRATVHVAVASFYRRTPTDCRTPGRGRGRPRVLGGARSLRGCSSEGTNERSWAVNTFGATLQPEGVRFV